MSEFEQNDANLIALYEELAPDGRVSIHYNRDTHKRVEMTEKSSWLSRMKKWQDNKVQFKKFITDEKYYFLGVSCDLRWMKALLKCHNFVDCKKFRYDKELRKSVEVTDDKTLEVFKLAKLELKKKK